MTNPTSNFGWQMPTPTDLVTDLPADFEVFGQAVDTSMADLRGGTTGQILSKATNTDMDFTWITNDVGDITNIAVTSPITGGGSSGSVTIGVSAASTSASGVVQLSDSTSTTSSVLAATPTAVKAAYDKASTAATTSVAGIVQLSDSTSTTSSVLASTPTATKSAYDLANTANTTANAAVPKSTVTTAGDVIYATGSSAVTRLGIGTAGQVLTVNGGATAPTWATPTTPPVNLLLNSNFALNQRAYVSGANLASGAYGFDRWKSNFTNTTLTFTASTQGQQLTINSGGGLQQIIEQGLVPAGTYTLSWTGTATARVYNVGATAPSFAASPVTFTADGTANVIIEFTATGATKTVSKVQFNAGIGTNWSLATPTLQSELAACQRYYYRITSDISYGVIGASAWTLSTTTANAAFPYAQTMRTAPSAIEYSSLGLAGNTFGGSISAVTLSGFSNKQYCLLDITGTGFIVNLSAFIRGDNNAAAYLGFTAELQELKWIK